jgi:hypothetical protein
METCRFHKRETILKETNKFIDVQVNSPHALINNTLSPTEFALCRPVAVLHFPLHVNSNATI